MKALARREKKKEGGSIKIRFILLQEKKRHNDKTMNFFLLSCPIIRLEGGGGRVTQCCLHPLQGHFIMFSIIQRGSFVRTPLVAVILIILKHILPPSPPKVPALLWPSVFSKTHIFSFNYSVCALRGFAVHRVHCMCVPQFLCVCIMNFLKVTFASYLERWVEWMGISSYGSSFRSFKNHQ